MPGRGGILFSCTLHLAVVALFFMHLHLFEEPIPDETPIAVELVNLAPETHATEKTLTPPTPKQPDKVAQNEPAPKPEPPKPEPPKPPPPPPTPPPPPPRLRLRLRPHRRPRRRSPSRPSPSPSRRSPSRPSPSRSRSRPSRALMPRSTRF